MRVLAALFSFVTLGLAAACGAYETPTSPSSTGGRLNLMITDSPFSDARALLVTFSEVTVHQPGGGFRALPFAGGGASRTCDLKKLVDAQDVLGTGPLQAGRYTQIRLVVSSASLYFDNPSEGPPCSPSIAAPVGRSEPVEIASGEVRLNRTFEALESGVTTMLIDFDGDRSVRQTGNGRYIMTPVITVVSVQ